MEVHPNRQYGVMMDGSRQITLRNRKFLRQIPPESRKAVRTASWYNTTRGPAHPPENVGNPINQSVPMTPAQPEGNLPTSPAHRSPNDPVTQRQPEAEMQARTPPPPINNLPTERQPFLTASPLSPTDPSDRSNSTMGPSSPTERGVPPPGHQEQIGIAYQRPRRKIVKPNRLIESM